MFYLLEMYMMNMDFRISSYLVKWRAIVTLERYKGRRRLSDIDGYAPWKDWNNFNRKALARRKSGSRKMGVFDANLQGLLLATIELFKMGGRDRKCYMKPNLFLRLI